MITSENKIPYRNPQQEQNVAVLFKEAYCTLCFALCAFSPLIFSLCMTSQRQALQSNKLVHIYSSCLALVYHLFTSSRPRNTQTALLLCARPSHLLFSHVFMIEVRWVSSVQKGSACVLITAEGILEYMVMLFYDRF